MKMMASIINVLYGSFRLLVERPVFFIPKLLSAIIGALWFVGMVSGYGPIYLYLVTGPLIALFGSFEAVILAAMVRNKDDDSILKNGLTEALERWKQVLVSTVVIMAVLYASFLPFAAGIFLFYKGRSLIWLVAGTGISLAMILAITFLIFFFPISLLEKDSVLGGFRDSARTSADNFRDAGILTLLSFALLIFASLVGNQNLEVLGYAGFVVMRLISAVITTYLFVVSPEYYLSN